MVENSAKLMPETSIVPATGGDELESRKKEQRGQTSMERGHTPLMLTMEDEGGLRKNFFETSPTNSKEATNTHIAAPSAPGVWRLPKKGINGCWELYPFNVAENIFQGFCDGKTYVEWIDSTVAKKRKRDVADHSSDSCITRATHLVLFATMKEVELCSGFETEVSIVQASISSVNYLRTEDPIEAGVWWKDELTMWQSYKEPIVHDILSSLRSEAKEMVVKDFTPTHPEGIEYIINLAKMYQRSPLLEKKQSIKIVRNEPMPSEILSGKAVHSKSKDLVQMSLKTLLSRQYIATVVAKTAIPASHKILAIETREHLKVKEDGPHSLYQKFGHTFESIIECVPGCCGQLLKICRQGTSALGYPASRETRSIVQHAFFFAPPSEIDIILKTGLPKNSKMKSESFAFATDYYELNHKSWDSLTYHLLLFLIVVPKCLSSHGFLNTIPVASIENQLPIAKISITIPETLVVGVELQLPVAKVTHKIPEIGSSVYQSELTDYNQSVDRTACKDIVQQTLSTSAAELDLMEITEDKFQEEIRTKQGRDILLVFKLYNPAKGGNLFVGKRLVSTTDRPSELLKWLQDISELPLDAGILLFMEDSTYVNPNVTYEESGFKDADMVEYTIVFTTNTRSPDVTQCDVYTQPPEILQQNVRYHAEVVDPKQARALDSKVLLTEVEPPHQSNSGPILDASMPLENLGPEFDIPDGEFHDFDFGREEKDMEAGQVWAIYDGHDGMPRLYGLVKGVAHSPFGATVAWLDCSMRRRWWVQKTGLTLTLGDFEINPNYEDFTTINVFSELVVKRVNPMRGVIRIYPRKDEVWAIYSDWDDLRLTPKPIFTPNDKLKQYYRYDILQMLEDYSTNDGVLGVKLVKAKSFKTIFHPLEDPELLTQNFQLEDLMKFSHRIRARKIMDLTLVPIKGALELDPATVPPNLW